MNPRPSPNPPACKMALHTFPKCRYLYRKYQCGHNEVVAIICHRWCRLCKGGKGPCDPRGMQDYQFDNDNHCRICQDEKFTHIDDVKRQRLLWARDARRSEKCEESTEKNLRREVKLTEGSKTCQEAWRVPSIRISSHHITHTINRLFITKGARE
jgi:hypothetical protein